MPIAASAVSGRLAPALGPLEAEQAQQLLRALAGVIGPLIEVPVLVSLVDVSLWLKRRFR